MVPGILMVLSLFIFTQGNPTRLKLFGGPGAWEGRLEVYHDRGISIDWYTVCFNEFGMNEATVVCHMLGYQRALGFVGWRHDYHTMGQLNLHGINCNGDETDLKRCASNPWYYTSICIDDVILHCLKEGTDPVKGVRLIGGAGPYEGTIELKVNGAWGTICDDDFDINDAQVICRMAGYPRALQAFEWAHFRKGNGSIMLSNLQCTGHETKIDDCGSAGWFRSTCDHREDAGVACLGNKREQTVQDVRLVGGSGPYEGTIELNINGVWGTVCDDDFDIKDGNVICRMAGYPRALQAFQKSYFGRGNGSILLSNLNCTGYEKNVGNCGSGGWYKHTCDHREDAGVACLGNQREQTVQDVRLVGGSGPYEGTIELNINGVWGTVCDDDFDINDGNVICRMAGYPSALQAFQQSHFGQGNGSIMLSHLHCTGHEKSVDNCGSVGWYNHNCDHREDAGVVCLGNQRKETVQDVRLVGGNGPYEGTIELNINGVWGTVCDDDFDINDGNVICRMAGYPRAIHTFGQAYFGRGKDSIMLSNLDCSGFEDSLESCNSAGWYIHTCDHSEDAGVECLGSNRSHIVEGVKLVGGAWPWEGRVELLVNGKWGTICNDNFDVNDAKVICSMAGYSPTGHIQAFVNNHFGHGKGDILLNDLQCKGFETNIENCTSAGWYNHNCAHNEDVGVSCLDSVAAIG